jgi:hypothetical protein
VKNSWTLSLCLSLSLSLSLLVGLTSELRAACPSPCPAKPCPVYECDTPISGTLNKTSFVTVECCGNPEWDETLAPHLIARAWADLFGVNVASKSDIDKVTWRSYSQQPNCECTIVADPATTFGETVLEIWSGSVDLTTPETYSLVCTLHNQDPAATSTIDGRVCTVSAPDPPLELKCTIEVVARAQPKCWCVGLPDQYSSSTGSIDINEVLFEYWDDECSCNKSVHVETSGTYRLSTYWRVEFAVVGQCGATAQAAYSHMFDWGGSINVALPPYKGFQPSIEGYIRSTNTWTEIPACAHHPCFGEDPLQRCEKCMFPILKVFQQRRKVTTRAVTKVTEDGELLFRSSTNYNDPIVEKLEPRHRCCCRTVDEGGESGCPEGWPVDDGWPD